MLGLLERSVLTKNLIGYRNNKLKKIIEYLYFLIRDKITIRIYHHLSYLNQTLDPRFITRRFKLKAP